MKDLKWLIIGEELGGLGQGFALPQLTSPRANNPFPFSHSVIQSFSHSVYVVLDSGGGLQEGYKSVGKLVDKGRNLVPQAVTAACHAVRSAAARQRNAVGNRQIKSTLRPEHVVSVLFKLLPRAARTRLEG